MENKRIVDINTYWATIVKDTAQFGQIAVAENPEFNRLSECIFRALEDSFIHSATEYGVKRWESMLQIAPSAGETLEDRKARILTYLNLKLPYTWRVLKQLIEGIVGADKVTLDLVNDEGKLIVHTDRTSDEKLQTVSDLIERVVPMNLVVERYNHDISINWRELMKYAECVTVDDMLAVNPDYKNDLTSDGEWVYPLPELVNGRHLFNNARNLKVFSVTELPEVTDLHDTFIGTKLERIKLNVPKLTNLFGTFAWVTTLKWAEVQLKNAYPADLIGGFRDCTSLSHVRINLDHMRNSQWLFEGCQLDKDSTLHILTQLRTFTDGGTHNLSIGIHIDNKTDDEVIAAIANAEDKGWTLTMQWNGTPTSGISTLDLEEIYAKVIECEEGDYTDENGNRCMLDWGHYVTDTTDYKLFFSIYEAEQYFKLTKIEGIEQ